MLAQINKKLANITIHIPTIRCNFVLELRQEVVNVIVF